MLTLESLPIGIPWIPGGKAAAIYDLVRVCDLTPAVFNSLQAPYLNTETELRATRAALEAQDPPAPDTAAQLATLAERVRANDAASDLHLIAYLVRRVEGIEPVPIPEAPETWGHIPPLLRSWLVSGPVLTEVRAQLSHPLSRSPAPRP